MAAGLGLLLGLGTGTLAGAASQVDCDPSRYYGIQHCRDNASKLEFILVDLSDPHVAVQTVLPLNSQGDECNSVNRPAKDPGSTCGGAEYPVEKVTDMLERYRSDPDYRQMDREAVAVINTDYFGSTDLDHGAQGLTVRNGVRLDGDQHGDNDDGRYRGTTQPALVFTIQNQASIGVRKTEQETIAQAEEKIDTAVAAGEVYNAVGGAPIIVRDGRSLGNAACGTSTYVSNYQCTNQQQSAAALTDDGKLILVSGHQDASGIARYLVEEFVGVFPSSQVHTALKFDGGDSASMAWVDRDGSIRPYYTGKERAVAEALMIFSQPLQEKVEIAFPMMYTFFTCDAGDIEAHLDGDLLFKASVGTWPGAAETRFLWPGSYTLEFTYANSRNGSTPVVEYQPYNPLVPIACAGGSEVPVPLPAGTPAVQIAYIRQNDIWIADLAINASTRLTFDGIITQGDGPIPSQLSWSADGRRLAFTSTQAGDANIYLLQFDESTVASDPIQVTFAPQDESLPAFSHTEPDILFYVRTMEQHWRYVIVRYDLRARSEAVVYDSGEDVPCTPTSLSVADQFNLVVSEYCGTGAGNTIFSSIIELGDRGEHSISLESYFQPIPSRQRTQHCAELPFNLFGAKWAWDKPSLAFVASPDCFDPGATSGGSYDGAEEVTIINFDRIPPQSLRVTARAAIVDVDWFAGDQRLVFGTQEREIWIVDITRGSTQRLIQDGSSPAARPKYVLLSSAGTGSAKDPQQPVGMDENLTSLASASASSTLTPDKWNSYSPGLALDDSPATSWVEGVEGPGHGESLLLTFPGPVAISRIRLDIGYDSGADTFYANNRIKTARLDFSGGKHTQVTFDDVRGMQMVSLLDEFGQPVTTDFLQLVIVDTFSGSLYDDTCLAEVEVWGLVPAAAAHVQGQPQSGIGPTDAEQLALGPVETTQAYYEALHAGASTGDFSAAYALQSKSRRSLRSYDDFRALYADTEAVDIQQNELIFEDATSAIVHVVVLLTDHRGQVTGYDVRYHLITETGAWRLDTPEISQLPVPTGD